MILVKNNVVPANFHCKSVKLYWFQMDNHWLNRSRSNHYNDLETACDDAVSKTLSNANIINMKIYSKVWDAWVYFTNFKNLAFLNHLLTRLT